MNKQMDDSKLLVKNSRKQNLLHVLAETASGGEYDLQEKVDS